MLLGGYAAPGADYHLSLYPLDEYDPSFLTPKPQGGHRRWQLSAHGDQPILLIIYGERTR